jgi:hypothetical protein
MVSAAVEKGTSSGRDAAIREIIGGEEHFKRWIAHPASAIVHHDGKCCEEARLWFLAYARSMEIGVASQLRMRAPTWLSQLFTWGPSAWPISWCQIVRQKVIDCGVFAALAREVFKAQGHEAHPAQALLSYNPSCTNHWKALWNESGKKKLELFPWIGSKVVYHELCVLELPDGQARFYDSTWGSWYLPRARSGFGALLALRSECPRLLTWNNKTFSCGEWVSL